MTDIFTTHLAETIIVIGLVLLAVEVAILGFSTFILFFLGLSLVMTGSAMWLGVLPMGWGSILLSNAIITGVLAFLLWEPLKKIQNNTEKKIVKNDFTGVTFYVESEINTKGETRHKYSGIDWQVKSKTPIEAGSEVEVVKAEVGTLWVEKVSTV